MQFRAIPALILFLGSYFPLSIILLVQDIPKAVWSTPACSIAALAEFGTRCAFPHLANPWRILSLFAVCGVSLLMLSFLLRSLKSKEVVTVAKSKSIPNDLINYVFPYVVSFMSLDFGDTGKYVGFIVFMGFMFLITYGSGQILMNPILLLFKWRIYEVEVSIGANPRVIRALSKKQLLPGNTYHTHKVQDMYVITN